MPKLINFGSLNIDKVYKVPHFVSEGETLSSSGYEEHCGGKGLNQSVAAKKAGLDVYHAGVLGCDGDILEECLRVHGVNLTHLQRSALPSGHAIIQVDPSGSNGILLFAGCNRLLTEAYIDETLAHFAPGDFVLTQNETNLVDVILKKGKEHSLFTVWNPSPLPTEDVGELLHDVDLLAVNRLEGATLSGETEPKKMISSFRARYPKMRVLLSLGEDGALYAFGNECIRQKAFSVSAVDTTGAGDTLCGFFLGALAGGRNAKDALRLACAAAALSVTKAGAADSVPDLADVNAFSKRQES